MEKEAIKGEDRLKAKRGTKSKSPEMEIVIKRHQQLFELLNDPHRMWRVLLSLFLIIIVLFVGIALVVLEIKKYYPYNVIETNVQGASFMKSEDKEVIYWLFNTADLWANSGIKVEKGDELTIRASGASYTAIHHLVDAARDNSNPYDQWVGTEGLKQEDPRDKLRAEFRINKSCDEGTLMMQIIPEDSIGKERDWMEGKPNFYKGKYVEIIGKERINLKISESGILHFAVNDIVLTDDKLNLMYCQYLDDMKISKPFRENLCKQFNSIKDTTSTIKIDGALICYNNKQFYSIPKDILDSIGRLGLGFGHYPVINNDSKYYNLYPFVNELVYYKQHKFRDAWFVDNLGSFLIIIERKKK